MMPFRRQSTLPRAIAVPQGTPVVPRLAWMLAAAAALLLAAAISTAAPARFASEADVIRAHHLRGAETVLDRDEAPAPRGEFHRFHAILHRATLRANDRPRRTAGRAGVSVRRSIGHASAVLPAETGAPPIFEGGTAPFGTHATANPPARGIVAHGVRGPPSFSFVAG